MTEYEPGVCNIGAGKQRLRYGLGAVSFAATLVLLVAVYALSLPPMLLLATFIPLFGAAEGYYQGRFGFCAGFGLLGVYDVSDGGDDRTVVRDADARRHDRRRSIQIHVYAAGTALAGALIVYAVGSLVT